jgi:uncharacterized GH25 family protein
VLFLAIVGQCHEFWLLSNKFKYAVGEEVKIDFLIGENFDGEPWEFKKNKIEKLELHHLANVTDIKEQVKVDERDKLKIKFIEAGTYLLSMQSDNAYIEMDAEKFNDYLRDEGIEDILSLREKTNSMNKPSRENYSRCAKLLIQSGNKLDDTFKKKVGLKLEIIPQQNPYTLHSGDYLQCLILFDSKPVPHQLVKVWNKIGLNTFLQNTYTENDGTIKFPINSKVPWMVSTVKMIASDNPSADWKSFWGSLVFGIE